MDIASGEDCKTFTVYIYPEPDFDHLKASVKPILSKRWSRKDAVNPSFATTALREQVPKDLTRHGLAWWNFETSPFRDSRMTAADRHQMRKWIPSKMGTPPSSRAPAVEKNDKEEVQNSFDSMRKQRITH